MWRSTGDRRHLFFSVSAAVGASRELFIFTVEYGSFRGYISYPTIFRYYPPIEHSFETLSIILMGYAFIRFYFNFEKFSRLFLICSSCLTVLTYIIIAPLWIRFLDATTYVSITGSLYIGDQFHSFPGDLVFRIIGVVVTLCILSAFLYARNRTIKAPWLAFLAFAFFFLDHALQAANDLCDDRYAPIFAPVRHCLHTGGIVLLVGAYWWEVTLQLNSRKQFLQSLLDAIPDHIFYKNMEGIYLGCNQTFAELFVGRPKEQIIGHSEQDLVSDPVLAGRFSRSDREQIDTDTSLTYELPYTLSDGKQVVLETIKTPFHDTDGQIAGLIGVSRDITERKNLEDQLRHSQKMDAIGQLAGGVAHDFNNILTAIIGFASLMQFEIDPNDPQASNLQQILSSSERAAKLVQDLMAFSRRETLTASSHNLNAIVSSLRNFLQRIITEDIRFCLNCSESALNVCVDSGQIEQALTNLVANARDAMPKGGELTIATQPYELDDSFIRNYGYGKPGKYALISVSDSGHGMEEETRKRIFEPFFTTKDVGKGTGLGLAIVYGIVKQHKGFVTVSSKPDKGTTFQIYLPIVEMAPEENKKIAEAIPPDKGTETILVVEDEPTVRSVVETALRKFNYTVICAEDGLDAVEQFSANSNTISLVLMDIIMPRMNGKVAADEIRKIKPAMKILFTSGYTADTIRSRGELEAGEEIIFKPVNPTELIRKMRQILDS
jgi:PAS domain S-box-containing protein